MPSPARLPVCRVVLPPRRSLAALRLAWRRRLGALAAVLQPRHHVGEALLVQQALDLPRDEAAVKGVLVRQPLEAQRVLGALQRRRHVPTVPGWLAVEGHRAGRPGRSGRRTLARAAGAGRGASSSVGGVRGARGTPSAAVGAAGRRPHGR